MKKALLITTDRYPNGDAGAVRTHVFAQLLKSLDYEPTIAGMGDSTKFKFTNYDGISYISFRFDANDLVSKVKGCLLFHQHLKRFLFKKENFWDVIIVVSVPKFTLDFLKKYANKNSIPLLHDSVEWYSPEQFSVGKMHPTYIAKDRWNRKYIDKSVKIIAISSFLENYFKSKGIQTTRVPVILDVKQTECKKNIDPNKIVFLYAGSPGKKDYLSTVIKGFACVNSNRSYELKIIGITKDQLVTVCGADPECIIKLGDKLCCMGRVSRQEVLNELSKADFTVLMRSQEQRYAKAGFPTKFVESLATATPVIANSTSDLEMYLENGKNGYLVQDESAESLALVLSRALMLSYEERCNMQRFARESAEENFDWRIYIQSFFDLLRKDY